MNDIRRIIARAGRWSLIGVITIIVAEHWKVINVSQIPIPNFLDWLYGYVLLNGAAASPFIYLEHMSAKPKICPQCNNPLRINPTYSCDKCGDLQFAKKDTKEAN